MRLKLKEIKTMEVLNTTKFEFAPLVGRIGFPDHSLTLILKATFDLKPDTPATLAEEQLFPTGCEPYKEDDEGTGSSRYDTDFAYYKPYADLLLAGNCHTPEGKAVPSCRVTFQVGNLTKSLAVFGNRYWQGLSQSQTTPEVFNIMPLKYENSFGGRNYKKNPVGIGHEKITLEDGSTKWPLPNIENINQLISSPNNNPDPMGYAALGQMWQQRYTKMGNYKGAWKKEQWPGFATDFDWSHYNSAPSDMQVKGYLNGDEELYFENLHPSYSQYRSKLPGVRIRLFIYEASQTTQPGTEFKEIMMNLDTLWVDMEAEKIVLLWRGINKILSEDYDEIKYLFIASEKLEEPLQTIEHYHNLFHKKLAEENSDEAYEVKPIEVDDTDDINIEEEFAKAEESMKASLIKAGLDPNNLPEQTPEQKAEFSKVMKELGIEEKTPALSLTRERVIEGIKQGESFANKDLSGLDLSGLKFGNINLQAAILSGVNFKNTDLSGAILAEAILEQADLSAASLRGVNLKDADLTGAKLMGSDLTGAMLEGAILEKTEMHRAILDQVNAGDAVFSESNLTEALFRNSVLHAADFSGCILDRVDFQHSDLSEASVEGATGIQVNMAETNLTELRATNGCDFSHGIFRQAKGKESMWEKANLTGADFSYCHFEGADFSSANLTTANLSAANMKFTRFIKADLSGAILLKMNLFQGTLEKTNLTGADLSGSNLYGVEFLDALFAKTAFKHSNLKMTRLYKD
jgi:uncharacterized protein YjbI with pentapeptide repeats